MEILVIEQSLKSSILNSTSFQWDVSFRGGVSAAVLEQSRHKASMVAQIRETGNSALEANSRILRNQKNKKNLNLHFSSFQLTS